MSDRFDLPESDGALAYTGGKDVIICCSVCNGEQFIEGGNISVTPIKICCDDATLTVKYADKGDK